MYYILHKDDKFIGVSPFVEATQIGLEGVSIEALDEVIPDMNSIVWDAENLRIVCTKIVFSHLEFLSRFTMEERIAIGMSTDPIVIDIMKLFESADVINLSDSRTIQAIGYMQMIGLLTTIRAQEILNA